ncbi:hypothetical protein LG293_16400 (plasmid) [Citricoccus nitrophenolicus]
MTTLTEAEPTTAPVVEPVLDTTKTPGLLQALRDHYIEPGVGYAGGVFLHEVSVNGGSGTGTRADAIYAGFTAASGRRLIGHELKVSRADWRRELAKAGKADFWHDNTHAWYIVAPSTDIVPPGELPDGWGLMVPRSNHRRFKVVVKAQVRDVTPSWDATRSILARQDTLAAGQVKDQVAEARRTIQQESIRQIDAIRASGGDQHQTRRNQELLEKFRDTTGFDLASWPNDERISAAEFQSLLELHRALKRLPVNSPSSFRATELQLAADSLRAGLDSITDVQRALAGFKGGTLPEPEAGL